MVNVYVRYIVFYVVPIFGINPLPAFSLDKSKFICQLTWVNHIPNVIHAHNYENFLHMIIES